MSRRLTIEGERLRRAFATPTDASEQSESCPPDGAIWDAACGDVDPARIEAVLAHLVACDACTKSWRAARAIAAAAAGQDSGVSLTERIVRPWRSRVLIGLAIAAGIATFLIVRPPGDAAPGRALRGGPSTAIESLVDERKPLPRDGFVLRWKTGAPGEVYSLEVAREDLTLVIRADEIETGEYRVPEAVLAGLPSGTVLLWRVDVLRAATTRATSPVFRAVLR